MSDRTVEGVARARGDATAPDAARSARLSESAGLIVNQLRSASVLRISGEAEATVSDLMVASLPKATTRHILAPRRR